jgi:hypothetical protein
MNVTIITDQATLTKTISECKILSELEGPGAGQTLVAVRDTADILIITDPLTGGGMVVHGCSEDGETGGSVHDHSRSLCS